MRVLGTVRDDVANRYRFGVVVGLRYVPLDRLGCYHMLRDGPVDLLSFVNGLVDYLRYLQE